jgi:Protein of unknown function (DUF4231)
MAQDARSPTTTVKEDLDGLYVLASDEAKWALKSSRTITWTFRGLSIASIALAAAAGVTVLPDEANRWIAAGLAFASAVVGGLSVTFRPQESSRDFRRRYVLWRRLADDVRVLYRSLDELSPAEAESRYQDLLNRRDEIASSDHVV